MLCSSGATEVGLALSQQPGLTFGAANSFGRTYKVGEVIGLYTREFLWRRSFAQKARVKANHLADFVRKTETVGGAEGKSRLLAQGQTYFDRPDAYKISLEHVRDATAEHLRLAANRWLSDGVYILEAHPFPHLNAASAGAD